MDLSLQTGWPLSAISRLSERELLQWDIYRLQKGFPFRRIELGLAQIALWIAKTMGGVENLMFQDFLFDPTEDDDEEMTEDELAELKEDIGFNPVE